MNSNSFLVKIKWKKYNNLQYMDIPKNLIWFSSEKASIGFEEEKTPARLIWGADSAADFLSLLRKTDFGAAGVKIEFVPEEFEVPLLQEGFSITGEFVDAWLYDLQERDFKIKKIGSIRVADRRDLEVASAITKSCRGISRGFEGESVDSLDEWFSETNNTGFFIINGDKPVGFLMVGLYGFERKEGSVCWIRELAIQPEFQGLGYGRELITAGLSWGKSKEAKKSFLAVDKLNIPAIKLYESLNYKINSDRGQVNMEVINFRPHIRELKE